MVKKICHCFQSRGNHTPYVGVVRRDNVECHRCPEINHNRRRTIKLRYCYGGGPTIGGGRRCHPSIRNPRHETTLHRHDFALPLVASDKIETAKELASTPGSCQYAGKEIAAVAQPAYQSGSEAVLLFGITKAKDQQAR